MLQRAASNAYSWWWASHIRTKQSKWLDTSLQDMEERVKSMLGLLEEEADSFAKKAEMYYKRRPELIDFIQESYKSYRALAERYDHISGELHKANNTIAAVIPDQHFGIDYEEEDDNSPKPVKSGKLKKMAAAFEEEANKSSKTEKPIRSKDKDKRKPKNSLAETSKAKEEIDKLQKDILVLQTEKEFIKGSYESGLAKYWDIEKKITEMQEKACKLQDKFSVEDSVIEDDEARSLMAMTALKSCESTLDQLHEKQKLSTEEAKVESERIKNAKEKFEALKSSMPLTMINESSNGETKDSSLIESSQPVSTMIPDEKKQQAECRKVRFQVDKDMSILDLAENIDELVHKVIALETTISSQTAQIQRLRIENDELQRNLQSLEDEKKALLDNPICLTDKLKLAGEELHKLQSLENRIQVESSKVEFDLREADQTFKDLSGKLHPPNKQKETITESAAEDKENYSNETKREGKKESTEDSKQDKPGNEMEKDTKSIHSTTTFNLEQAHEITKCESISKTDKGATPDKVSILKNKQENLDHSEEDNKVVTLEQVSHNDLHDNSRQEAKELVTGNITESHKDFRKVTEEKEAQEKHKDRKKEAKGKDTPKKQEDLNEEIEGKGTKIKHEDFHEETKEKDTQEKHDDVKKETEGNDTQEKDEREETKGKDAQENQSFQQKKNAENDEISPQNWQHMFMDGLEDREKILLAEYTSILRNYKETKRKLADAEKKNQDCLFETRGQIRDLKNSMVMKDEEIRSLRQKLSLLEASLDESPEVNAIDPKTKEICRLASKCMRKVATSSSSRCSNENVESQNQDIKSNEASRKSVEPDDQKNEESGREPLEEGTLEKPVEEECTTSKIEEKFRKDIDERLEENLEFWLRFSSSVQQIQPYQTTVKELQTKAQKLKKRQDGNSGSSKHQHGKPDTIYKQLGSLKADLSVWREQNALLKEELQSRFSALCSIKEEILKVSQDGGEGEGVQFTAYQASKFVGEVVNMQQENNKVADELQVGLDQVKNLQAEVEKTMNRLRENFDISAVNTENQDPSGKKGVPLRNFLFGAKPKKHSIFHITTMMPRSSSSE